MKIIWNSNFNVLKYNFNLVSKTYWIHACNPRDYLGIRRLTVQGQPGKKFVKPHLKQSVGAVALPVILAMWEAQIGGLQARPT
jgi:hypothetical protein